MAEVQTVKKYYIDGIINVVNTKATYKSIRNYFFPKTKGQWALGTMMFNIESSYTHFESV